MVCHRYLPSQHTVTSPRVQQKYKPTLVSGEKNPEVSIKCPFSSQLLSRLLCTELSVYLPLELFIPVYVITYYFFWPCLETMRRCVCSGSFRVRNSKRGTISSVGGRKRNDDSIITTDSILGFAKSMHGHAQIRGRAEKGISGNRTAVLSMLKYLMLFFKAVFQQKTLLRDQGKFTHKT